MSSIYLYDALVKLGLANKEAKKAVDDVASTQDVATKADIAELKTQIAELKTQMVLLVVSAVGIIIAAVGLMIKFL